MAGPPSTLGCDARIRRVSRLPDGCFGEQRELGLELETKWWKVLGDALSARGRGLARACNLRSNQASTQTCMPQGQWGDRDQSPHRPSDSANKSTLARRSLKEKKANERDGNEAPALGPRDGPGCWFCVLCRAKGDVIDTVLRWTGRVHSNVYLFHCDVYLFMQGQCCCIA